VRLLSVHLSDPGDPSQEDTTSTVIGTMGAFTEVFLLLDPKESRHGDLSLERDVGAAKDPQRTVTFIRAVRSTGAAFRGPGLLSAPTILPMIQAAKEIRSGSHSRLHAPLAGLKNPVRG